MQRAPDPTETLFKSHGILWSVTNTYAGYQIYNPHCPNEMCHSILVDISKPHLKKHAYYCTNCDKEYPFDVPLASIKQDVQRRFEGYMTLEHPIISLDLPPTAVAEKNEDENYWVRMRMTEKDGKRMAVVYVGEKVKQQTKQDYVQLFIDLDDELLRFDKGNKNPIKLLCKLTAEFPGAIVTVERRDAEPE